jgi:hypothetical protein
MLETSFQLINLSDGRGFYLRKSEGKCGHEGWMKGTEFNLSVATAAVLIGFGYVASAANLDHKRNRSTTRRQRNLPRKPVLRKYFPQGFILGEVTPRKIFLAQASSQETNTISNLILCNCGLCSKSIPKLLVMDDSSAYEVMYLPHCS